MSWIILQSFESYVIKVQIYQIETGYPTSVEEKWDSMSSHNRMEFLRKNLAKTVPF